MLVLPRCEAVINFYHISIRINYSRHAGWQIQSFWVIRSEWFGCKARSFCGGNCQKATHDTGCNKQVVFHKRLTVSTPVTAPVQSFFLNAFPAPSARHRYRPFIDPGNPSAASRNSSQDSDVYSKSSKMSRSFLTPSCWFPTPSCWFPTPSCWFPTPSHSFLTPTYWDLTPTCSFLTPSHSASETSGSSSFRFKGLLHQEIANLQR
jgi:hypothetical protein